MTIFSARAEPTPSPSRHTRVHVYVGRTDDEAYAGTLMLRNEEAADFVAFLGAISLEGTDIIEQAAT